MKKNIIYYHTEHSKFGFLLFGFLDQKICFLEISSHLKKDLARIKKDFSGYEFIKLQRDPLSKLLKKIKNQLEQGKYFFDDKRFYFQGTPLQIKVWQTLGKIPMGKTVSYQELANMVGKPKAVRAVASAVAKNRIALLVPCHRVIRSDGSLGQYRWGGALKKQLLNFEQSSISH